MPHFEPDQPLQYDPVAKRTRHRISVLYSVDHTAAVATEFGVDYADVGEAISEHLSFDRLAGCYLAAGRQFPRVLCQVQVDHTRITIPVQHNATLVIGRLWLFALPYGSLALALTIEVAGDVFDCIPVMEALHHKHFEIDDKAIWPALRALVPEHVRPHLEDSKLGPEVHQILYVSSDSGDRLVDPRSGDADRAAVADLIYRYRGDAYNPGNSRIRYPPESNRERGTLAATGPYVAVIAGQQGYVENAFFVSAVQMIGAAALLRRIRIEVYEELLRLRRLTARGAGNRKQMRTQLTVMSERLGHLELELSFGVEAHESIGSLVPSLRVIDYHRALFGAADMPEEAKTVATMLARLARAIHSELESVRTSERVSDERRRVVGSIIVGFLTLVALPLGIVFGYFGVATNDVDGNTSLFDVDRYRMVYGVLAGIVLVAIVLSAGLYLTFRRAESKTKEDRAEVERLDQLG